MAKEVEKEQTKTHYLVLEDCSYANGCNLVNIKKDIEKDVFLNTADVPQEALSELLERELVRAITL